MTVRDLEIPTADRTINLTSATEAALSSAIDQARVGEVTRIVLPKDQTIHFTSSWATKNITGKDIIIDFNGATIKYDVDTGLSFRGSYEWTKAVSALSVSNGDTALSVAGGVPSDLKVGDWLKIVSDDTTPGDRTTNRYMGEALQVKAIVGNNVIFDGQLDDQQLYSTNIRVAKYGDGSVTIIDPTTVGSLTHATPHIIFRSMIEPTVINPDATQNGGSFILFHDTIRGLVAEPHISQGQPDAQNKFWSYGIEAKSATQTAVYSNDPDLDFTQTRSAVDGQQPTVTNPNDIAAYGPSHDTYIKGITVTNSLTNGIGSHSGGWGHYFDGVTVHDTFRAVGVRGRNEVYKDLNVYNVQEGIQFYNEGNTYIPNTKDSYNIYVIGGTYKVSKIGFFTSGTAGNNLVDEIHFQNTYWEHSGAGWFSSIQDAKGDWTFTNDTIKLTGTASVVFHIGGSGTTLKADGLVIDLSEYKGSSIRLFSVDPGSEVEVTRLTVINPHGVKVVAASGGGSADISYGARISHPLPAIVDGPLEVLDGSTIPPVHDSDSPPAPLPSPPQASPAPPTPSNEPASSETADLAWKPGAYGKMYEISASNLGGKHAVKAFDSLTDDDQHHDTVDLSAAFKALGGRFTDGVNDASDRLAATHLTMGDFDGDKRADDVRLTIDGAIDFAISFIDPTTAGLSNWGIGNPSAKYNDVITGGADTASTTASALGGSTSSPVAVSSQTNKLTFTDDKTAYTVRDFDNFYASKDGVVTDPNHDTLNIGGVFDSIGGHYTDGVNDIADRKAGLHLAVSDFNGDGKADDVRLTITGANEFSVTFLHPDSSYLSTWNIGEGKHWMDDIIIV